MTENREHPIPHSSSTIYKRKKKIALPLIKHIQPITTARLNDSRRSRHAPDHCQIDPRLTRPHSPRRTGIPSAPFVARGFFPLPLPGGARASRKSSFPPGARANCTVRPNYRLVAREFDSPLSRRYYRAPPLEADVYCRAAAAAAAAPGLRARR